jgi:hypothetical protein
LIFLKNPPIPILFPPRERKKGIIRKTICMSYFNISKNFMQKIKAKKSFGQNFLQDEKTLLIISKFFEIS